MTEPLTLAQRLRRGEILYSMPRTGPVYEGPTALHREAAERIEADTATIASLRDANKALTAAYERAQTGFDFHASRAERERDRATAAEAKLAKVEAELEEHKVMLFDAYGGDVTATALFQQRLDERLSAELAEARRVIVKSDEDLRSIHLHIEEHSFPRANGIISQALFRIRSFLASNTETVQPSAGEEQRKFHEVLADAQKFNDSLPESIRRETRSFLASKEASQ